MTERILVNPTSFMSDFIIPVKMSTGRLKRKTNLLASWMNCAFIIPLCLSI